MIKARGQMNMAGDDDVGAPEKSGANQVVIVNFEEGDYKVTNTATNATY
jgi:hypothetical protein